MNVRPFAGNVPAGGRAVQALSGRRRAARTKGIGSRAERCAVRAGEFDALKNLFASRLEGTGKMERDGVGNRGSIHEQADYEAIARTP